MNEKKDLNRILYSEDAFFQQVLNEFISPGESETNTRTLLTTFTTATNDGLKKEPLGIRLKLPPFKGWENFDL